MKEYIYCLFLIIISTSLPGQEISEELESEINRRVEAEINPSISIGILMPDGSTDFYNFGYLNKSQQQADSLTLYEIGSVTKTFTALLANSYLKDAMHKPLSAFFQEINNPKLQSITPYQLQNHTAGLPRLSTQFSPKNWSDPFNGYSNDILQEELLDLNPDTSKAWSYSNFGYGILGRTIEITSQKSFDSLMVNLLSEIGMVHTLLLVPKDEFSKMAKPINLVTSNSHWHFTGPSRYAGGILSNTKDLLSYLSYQKENNPLFTKDSLKTAIQTKVPNLGKEKLFYQDGWFVLKPDQTTNILLHNGGTGGYISFVGYNKNTETGVVVLSNGVSIVDDIGIKVLYPSFELNHPKRTIAFELADDIDAGYTANLLSKYEELKRKNYPNDIIGIYWLERYYFGKENYTVSVQLSDIMVQELADDWEVYDIKGQNHEQLKKYEKAIEAYEKALKLNPERLVLKEKIKRCTKLHKHTIK